MSALLRFPLSAGGEVVVDADDLGVGRAGRLDDAVTRASTTFEDALDSVTSAAEVALARFRRMAGPPSEIEVQFGVRLTGELGAVIAKAGGETHLTVRVMWSADD